MERDNITIPVTDKLWVKCKFDENFNEVSYIDNKGKSYEFINPIKGTLLFYSDDNVNLRQESLDNIKNFNLLHNSETLIKSFIESFDNLTMEADFIREPNIITFYNNNDRCIFKYDIIRKRVYLDYELVWSKLKDVSNFSYDEIEKFLISNFRVFFHFEYLLGVDFIDRGLSFSASTSFNIYI